VDLNLLKAAFYARRHTPSSTQGSGKLLCLLLALPISLGMFWWGFRVAWVYLPQAQSLEAIQRVMFLPLILGALGGLWDGSPVLDAHSFAPFQVRGRDWFLAECLCALGTPVKGLLWGAGLAWCLGVLFGQARLFPWVLPLLPTAMVALVAAEKIVAGLSRQLGGSPRHLLLFLIFLSAANLGLKPLFMGRAWHPLLLGSRLPWSPGSHLMQAWQAVILQRPAHPKALLEPLAWTLGLLGLAALIALSQGRRPPQGLAAPVHPWSPSSPTMVVAIHQLTTLWQSRMGRFCLFLPFLGLLFWIDPLIFRLRPGAGYAAGAMGWALLPVGTRFGANLFGLDRSGVKTFWTLPLEDRHLLKGKLLGMGIFQGIVALLTLLTLASMLEFRGTVLLGMTLFLASLIVFQLAAGLPLSIRHPRPMDPRALKPSELDELHFRKLGHLLLPWVILVTAWNLSAMLGPALQATAMGLALALGLSRLPRVLRRNTRLLGIRREALTRALD